MPTVCYVLKGFPLPSETFVSDEAFALLKSGVDVRILHLQPSENGVTHRNAQTLVDQGRTRQMVQLPKKIVIWSLARLWLRRPVSLTRLLWVLRNDPERWMWTRAAAHALWCVENRVDYLHAHFADSNFKYAQIVSRLTGIPFGVTTHRYDLIDDPLPVSEASELFAAATSVITISEFNRELMVAKYAIPRERIRLIHCGVDLNEFSFRPCRRRSPKDALRVLSVGRLVHVKGHDVLIRAVGMLKRSGRSLQVRIVGAGPDFAALIQLAEREGVSDSVCFLGAQAHDVVQKELIESDLFVLASRSEGIPVACMETMATGTPIIATRINGLPELVDHRTSGLLVEPDDPSELAKAICWVIDNPDQVMQMAVNGREKVQHEFNRVNTTKQLLQMLSRVAGGANS